MQRDGYSAFLALHAVATPDADGLLRWHHDPVALEHAWQMLMPALEAKQLFIGERCGIAPVRARKAESSDKAPAMPGPDESLWSCSREKSSGSASAPPPIGRSEATLTRRRPGRGSGTIGL